MLPPQPTFHAGESCNGEGYTAIFDIAIELQQKSDSSATVNKHRSFKQVKVRTTFSFGYRSLCSARDTSNSPSETSVSQSTLNTIALGQEIVLVGSDVAVMTLYDDTSMNGSTGPTSLIVVELGDIEGLTAEMSEHAFYIYAP